MNSNMLYLGKGLVLFPLNIHQMSEYTRFLLLSLPNSEMSNKSPFAAHKDLIRRGDVIGPIQPPSGRGHKHVLCMMDQPTRWPEAVPLGSLTAKTACDSLLQICILEDWNSKQYHPRALAVGVIFEDDHEFGAIHPTPNLSRSPSERVVHETDLNHLKERLNFTVNLKNYVFGKTQIKFLGDIIGSGKHEPDLEKTAVINNLPVPKMKKELRSVLGLCNYYRESIPKYSELVYPLTELTKKRVPDSIPWTEKHDSSFHLLKNALMEAPLYSPVPDKPYTIRSDASQIGIAACLSQKCGDKCYPIAYASQKLSKTQQSW
ncbi:transposon Tf2-11 polyprotein [Trichonephila clavipes]|nr:transposon Tf2-11 polyprotein [Trichonephila clavipes]